MTERFGRYELLRPLGAGGMAEVFLARYVGPEGFEKRLVIKRVLPRFASDQRLLRMFFEEARTHVSLSHGNLVSVFDFGRVGNEYFIAMEQVRGADLARLMASTRLSPALVAFIGIELCRGLAYVHRRGLVHRDVSPRNVLLSVDGEVKLSDFGLVSSAADQAAGVHGTLAYTPPEQARGERVDGRGDLFALGIVLAEAVTGAAMRAAEDDVTALRIAREGAPLHVDGPLAGVIARATQTAPEARYASAEEMSGALEREAAALGVSREASVRELATRIAALTGPDDVTPAPAAEAVAATDLAPLTPPGPTAQGRKRVETYYRGNESEAFVDEVLARPARRRVAWLVAGGLGVLVAAGVGVRAMRGHAPPTARPIATLAPASPTPAPTKSATPAATAPPAATGRATPAPAATAPQGARTAHATHRPAPVGTGTLKIQCTPWCVPYVDDSARGPDRKNHALELPAGRHRVEARRLDDRIDRVVQIRPGETETLDFDFSLRSN